MTDERHYSPREIAVLWAVSPEWVRRRFKNEPGVVRLGSSWRIPQSVLDRVYQHSQILTRRSAPAKFRVRHLPDGSVSRTPKAHTPVR